MIPVVDDFRSSPMRHRFGDLYNPPGLTNFLGCVQAEMDPTAIRCLNFPPFATADTVTASLFIGNRYFASTGSTVTFTWQPDRIEREAEWDGWAIRSTTVLARARMAAIVVLEIENLRGESRTCDLRFALRGGVTRNDGPWLQSSPPMEYEHDIDVDGSAGTVRFTARKSSAVSLQGTVPAADRVGPDALSFAMPFAGRERRRITFLNVLAGDASEAARVYADLASDPMAEVEAVREEWNREIAAIFTPDNDRFGGHLPVLETSDPDLQRVYTMGALGVVYFKRESPASTIGRSYDTLMPRYWQSVTFLWDYHLSSVVHAQLDPHVMRAHLELWMTRDVHTCFGTEWLTGGPVGNWYSVNDYAMTRMIHDYVRWSGDRSWLERAVPGADGAAKTVAEHVGDYATNWRRFATANGLADYGGINNLLECVSTYIHEVAALNAGNVFNMRAAADIVALLGDDARATSLRSDAEELVGKIMSLYVEGAGHWNTRFPDGRLVPVKHCYDFSTILATIADDLSPKQREEMAAFCLSELMTPTWMHALACSDPDAAFDVRPDHQWTGAYPAWPPQAVAGLYRIGKAEEAMTWLRGLAKSSNQGPYGQAHFAESVIAPEDGGAIKSPSDFPWICDWACSSNGAWSSLVLESVFGVEAPLDGELRARPVLTGTDPDARLRNLAYQGRLYDVDRNGVRPAGD